MQRRSSIDAHGISCKDGEYINDSKPKIFLMSGHYHTVKDASDLPRVPVKDIDLTDNMVIEKTSDKWGYKTKTKGVIRIFRREIRVYWLTESLPECFKLEEFLEQPFHVILFDKDTLSELKPDVPSPASRIEEFETAKAEDLISTVLEWEYFERQEHEEVVLALGLDPLQKLGKVQFDNLKPLLSYIRKFCKSKGIKFIAENDKDLLEAINKEKEENKGKETRVVALVDILSDQFESLRNETDIKLVGFDSSSAGEGSYFRLVELLDFTLRLAFGYETTYERFKTGLKIKKHDVYRDIRVISYIPNADPVDATVMYRSQIKVLMNA